MSENYIDDLDDLEEIIQDFIVEAGELIEQLDQDLITLEKNPKDLELLDQIFRAFHSIKGNAAFMGFEKLTEFTHQTENVLDKLRSEEMFVTEAVMDLILEAVDVMKDLMDNLRNEEAVSIESIVSRLKECMNTPQKEAEDELDTLVIKAKEITDASEEKPESSPTEIEEEIPAQEMVIELKEADSISVTDEYDEEELEEIIQDFTIEAGELIEQLDQDLIKLEENPHNLELVDSIFRAFHTIKGNASFIGFQKLTNFTHQTENVLDKLRSGDMLVTETVMDLILEAVDIMKLLMENLRNEEAVDVTETMGKLKELLEGGSSEQIAALLLSQDSVTVETSSTPAEPESAPEPPGPPVNPVAEATPPPQKAPPTPKQKKPEQKKRSLEEQTIRVDVERLDALMNLAGELVIAKNRLQQFNSLFEENHAEDSDLADSLRITTGMINFVTSQFQEVVMKTRMLPIKKIFSRIPRMVRDLSRETGKKVRLVMEGEETELDKSVLEHIGDPLVHIIRNAVDHGLETPETRRASGKKPEGSLKLIAYSEGNYIIILIQDDGKGINSDIILKKAIEKGITTPEEGNLLNEREKLDFLFAPGFSTAETVTDISGRGVGMNVVKENIEKLDGLIDIKTKVGEGSIFKIQLPLTMAIVPALLVKTGESVFAIPLANVLETLVISKEDIYTIDQKEVIHLRDRILSLVHLRNLLQLEGVTEEREKYYVIILGIAEQRIGLLVDKLLGQEEVVIKTLGPFFSDINIIAGATIMGDGSVVLILDVASIINEMNRKHVVVSAAATAKE